MPMCPPNGLYCNTSYGPTPLYGILWASIGLLIKCSNGSSFSRQHTTVNSYRARRPKKQCVPLLCHREPIHIGPISIHIQTYSYGKKNIFEKITFFFQHFYKIIKTYFEKSNQIVLLSMSNRTK